MKVQTSFGSNVLGLRGEKLGANVTEVKAIIGGHPMAQADPGEGLNHWLLYNRPLYRTPLNKNMLKSNWQSRTSRLVLVHHWVLRKGRANIEQRMEISDASG